MVNPILTTSVSVGFETLRTNPLRTILSTLGIVIGVAALVSVLSVGDGMERLARDQIGRTTDLRRIAVTPRMFQIIDGTPFPQPNPVKFSTADAVASRAGRILRVLEHDRGWIGARGDDRRHDTALGIGHRHA